MRCAFKNLPLCVNSYEGGSLYEQREDFVLRGVVYVLQ